MRDRTAEAVIAAMNFLGVPYRRGGNSADEGFDCSGFTRHIFELTLGLVLPAAGRRPGQCQRPGRRGPQRTAAGRPGVLQHPQANVLACRHLHRRRQVHPLTRSGSEVRIEDMRYAYWSQRFTGARRAATAATIDRGESSLPAGGS